MGAFIYIYIMMDVLVKARTGLLGYFLCVVSVLLLASCGLDLFSSDKDDDKECAETVDKVPLEPGLEELGGYALQQSIHYIYSDTLEFDMHVSVVEDGYDRSGCPDAQVIYGYRRVVLEGPNPLLSMGMSIKEDKLSDAAVHIMIGAYTFSFRAETEKEVCKVLGQDALYGRVGYCIADENCIMVGCSLSEKVSHLDSLKINGITYKDVFKVKHSVYGSNHDNIYFSAEKGLLRFEKEDGSFIEIREKRRQGRK